MDETPRRTERDSMGDVEVPADALWGASTARAIDNFSVSGTPLPRRFLRALGWLKLAAAGANRDLGLLDPQLAAAIEQAAREVASGVHDGQFPVDVFQTGSGTSTNMNANEVIANRAAELLGSLRGARDVVHPNDHVNLGQSSNDVVPTALHLAASGALREVLIPAVLRLEAELRARSLDTWDVVKTGRTHLQDATPIRLGQVFLGHAGQVERARRRLEAAVHDLAEVALGGTAVGTGINTHPEFARRTLAVVAHETGIELRETDNHFQAQSAIDTSLSASAAVRGAAVAVRKIADDVRWLASGPRAGLGEIEIPAMQPGSSIMPGKVNPVIAESTLQACAHVLAADAAMVHAACGGNFELNTRLPLAAHHLIGAIEILGAAIDNFAVRCVAGIRATSRGPELLERGLGLATALVPAIGYDRAAAIAHEAMRSGRTIREVARETSGLTEEELRRLLGVKS